MSAKMNHKQGKRGRNNRRNKPMKQPGTIVNRSSQFSGLAPRLRTKLNCEFVGQIAVGSATLTEGCFACSANNLQKPFILSAYATGINKIDNNGTSGITGLFSSSGTSIQYNGESTLGNFYSTYHIYKSKLTLVVNQQSAIDTQLWTVSCVPYAEFNANSYPLFPTNAVTQQNMKQFMTSAGGGTKKMTVSADMAKTLGYTPLQYSTVLPTAFTGTATNNFDDVIWIVSWFNASNAVTNGEMFVTVRLECDIECQGPLTPF
jgi:hypothetical protein